jgi:DHA2 family multidrug resistance protein
MKGPSDNLKWWVLLTVIIGTFLGRLDQTIVTLALPKIIDEFGITISAAGWIGTAYIIANAIFVPVWGKLGDTVGRKRIYLIGFSVFIIGSVLAGISWNLGSMLVFRIIQAVAASADYPTAMAIVAVTFREARERAQALGLWSSSFAAAAVFGPLIGGPLIDNLGWRWIFYINVPVGLLGIFMALRFVRESVSEKKTTHFDFAGAITLGIALSSLVLVLDKGMDWGWLSLNSTLTYAVVIAFACIFYFVEKNSEDPIIDFKFFRNSVFVGTLVNNFIVFMGMMGALFILPVFVQSYLGFSATQTGYLFMPMAFFMMTSAFLGGRLVGKIKANHIIAISTFIAGIGLFLFSIFIDPRATAIDIIIPISVMAFGMGLGMSQRTTLITNNVPTEEVGIASSVLALGRNIAGAFGIALFATVLNSSVEKNVINIAQNTVINVKSPLVYQQVAALVILKAQITGFKTVFIISSTVVFIGAVLAIFLKTKNGNQKAEKVIIE